MTPSGLQKREGSTATHSDRHSLGLWDQDHAIVVPALCSSFGTHPCRAVGQTLSGDGRRGGGFLVSLEYPGCEVDPFILGWRGNGLLRGLALAASTGPSTFGRLSG